MIRANELMLEDWVRIMDDALERQYLNDYQPGQIVQVTEILDYGINPDWMGAEVNDLLHFDIIEPIPITPEILEKNGLKPFEIDRLRDKHSSAKWWAKGGSFFVKQYNFKHNDFKPTYSIGTHPNSLIVGLKYVHQLQHALRLCGIERDIIL